MNVEEVLERAKVHMHSDFDDCNNGIYTATRFNPPNYQTIDDIINDMVKRWNSRVN